MLARKPAGGEPSGHEIPALRGCEQVTGHAEQDRRRRDPYLILGTILNRRGEPRMPKFFRSTAAGRSRRATRFLCIRGKCCTRSQKSLDLAIKDRTHRIPLARKSLWSRGLHRSTSLHGGAFRRAQKDQMRPGSPHWMHLELLQPKMETVRTLLSLFTPNRSAGNCYTCPAWVPSDYDSRTLAWHGAPKTSTEEC